MNDIVEKEYVSCNLCGASKTLVLYYSGDMRYENTPRTMFRVVKCSNCGLIYVNPRPTRNEIGKFYPSEFYSFRTLVREQSKVHATEKDKGPVLEKLRDKYMEFRGTLTLYEKVGRVERVINSERRGRILDIGSAAGHFLGAMKARGWTAHGVDVSKEMCHFARNTYGLHITCGELQDASYPDNFFDVVTLWATFPHLHDPLATLLEVARILKKGGIIMVSVSNAESIDDYFFRNSRFDIPRHLYHFSPRTLRLMMSGSNLGVKHISHFTLTTSSKVESRLASVLHVSKRCTFAKIANIFWKAGTIFLGIGISCIFAFLRHGHTIIAVGVKDV